MDKKPVKKVVKANKTYVFLHKKGSSEHRVIALSEESARYKLEEEVKHPTDWRIQK